MNNEAHINQGVDMYGRQKPDLLSPRECAIIAAQAADEKKATDIMVQQVGDLIGVTEYFVICTASNNRQVEAVVDEIEEQCRVRGGAKPTARGRCLTTAASSCTCSSLKRASTTALRRCGTMRRSWTWKPRRA